jgi:AcrR family transcriptional regulator
MARQRLTREQSRALTRAELLQAGTEVFAEKGFVGASVEEISERAGYTRGAFYWNFTDKEELFLAIMDERRARSVGEIGQLVSAAHSPQELFDLLRARDAANPGTRTWFLASMEFHLYAMRNPSVGTRLAQRHAEVRRAIAKAIVSQFADLGVAAPAPPEQLALIVQSLETGLLVEQYLDPEHVPENSLYQALSLLLEAGAALSRGRRRQSDRSPPGRRSPSRRKARAASVGKS